MSKFYNEIAEKYDYIFPLSPAHQTFFASELCDKTVLDVGAATGNLTAHLLSQGYEVTAIDLSERLIAEAAKKGIVVQSLNMLDIDQLAIFDNMFVSVIHCRTSIVKLLYSSFCKKPMDNLLKRVNLFCK